MYQIFKLNVYSFFLFNLIEPLTIKVSTAVSIQLCFASLFAKLCSPEQDKLADCGPLIDTLLLLLQSLDLSGTSYVRTCLSS